MKLALLCILLAASTYGCVETPIASTPTNNGDIAVDTLFTHDGCTVYRFRDIGYHYYVHCRDHAAATTSRISCGKGCTQSEEIPTMSAELPPIAPSS